MATATKDEGKAGEGTTTEGQPPIGGAPPEVKPAVTTEPPKADAKPPKEGAAPAGDAKPEAGAKSAKDVGSEGELPDDDDLIQLSSRALKQRLDRATAKQLKERFGTSDTDSIKAKLDKLETFEKEAEEKRRAALAKEERLEEDRKKAEERANNAERQLALAKEERVVDKEEDRLKTLAGDFVKPKFWKHVARDLAEHLRDNYTAAELAGLKDKDLKKWFGDYIKENPEYSKEAAQEAAQEAREEKLSNGAKTNARPDPKGAADMTVKTFKPGQPNTMTRAEMAKLGVNY